MSFSLFFIYVFQRTLVDVFELSINSNIGILVFRTKYLIKSFTRLFFVVVNRSLVLISNFLTEIFDQYFEVITFQHIPNTEKLQCGPTRARVLCDVLGTTTLIFLYIRYSIVHSISIRLIVNYSTNY